MTYRLSASLLDSLGIGMCVFDAANRTVLWNDHFLKFFPEHAGWVHPGEPYAENLRRFYRLRLSPDDLVHIDRYIDDGIRRHMEQTQSFVFLHRGRKLRAAVAVQANGDRVRIWNDLTAMESSAIDPAAPLAGSSWRGAPSLSVGAGLQVFDQLSDGVAIHDAQGRIVFANDRFLTLYGARTQQEVVGHTLPALIRRCWHTFGGEVDPQVAQDVHAALHDSLQFAGVPVEIPLPQSRWIRVSIGSNAGDQVCSCHFDISREKQVVAEMRLTNERLRLESHRDALTGLLNRRGLLPLLTAAAQGSDEHSLLFIDLDGFKAVNDLAGHAQGDGVLCQVAAAIQGSVRAQDSVVRMGGDEFVVLLQRCGHQQALGVAQKIVEVVSACDVVVHKQVFRVGASVGVRTFQGEAACTDDYLQEADAACYQAKREGRGRVVAWSPSCSASFASD